MFWKTPVLESFLNKIVGLEACNFIKWRLPYSCPVNFAKFLRTSISKNICQGLVLTRATSVGVGLMRLLSMS